MRPSLKIFAALILVALAALVVAKYLPAPQPQAPSSEASGDAALPSVASSAENNFQNPMRRSGTGTRRRQFTSATNALESGVTASSSDATTSEPVWETKIDDILAGESDDDWQKSQ